MRMAGRFFVAAALMALLGSCELGLLDAVTSRGIIHVYDPLVILGFDFADGFAPNVGAVTQTEIGGSILRREEGQSAYLLLDDDQSTSSQEFDWLRVVFDADPGPSTVAVRAYIPSILDSSAGEVDPLTIALNENRADGSGIGSILGASIRLDPASDLATSSMNGLPGNRDVPIPPSRWVHFAITYDRKDFVRVYLSGEEVYRRRSWWLARRLEAGSYELEIRGYRPSSGTFGEPLRLDDVQLFTGALSPGQVEQLAGYALEIP